METIVSKQIEKEPGSRNILDFLILNFKVRRSRQFLYSLVIILLVSALCYSLSRYIDPESVALILLMTLSIIAMFFDISPVLLTALLSAVIWDFFFLPPKFALYINKTEHIVTLCMYFVIALLNAVLTYKIRKIEKDALIKEEKAQSLKLYNTLFNSLSHEFRTPIATIVGASDHLLAPSNLSAEDQKNLASEIAIASLRLNQQVENLLNISRLESGFIQPRKDWCDIHELICDVVQKLGEYVKYHRVEISEMENFPLFRLDYGLTERVLYNLIYNAAEYTPAGSCIKIKASQYAEGLLLTVEDTGSGFPKDEINKVFEKFYRFKNSKAGGTGLGLSIVKGFVEAQNGRVGVQNLDSGGAIFEIHFPTEKIFTKVVQNE